MARLLGPQGSHCQPPALNIPTTGKSQQAIWLCVEPLNQATPYELPAHSPSYTLSGNRQRADLGIAGRAEPALTLRQLLSVYARLQTLLMVASVASTIAQYNVIVLRPTASSQCCPQRIASFIPKCGQYAHCILERTSPAKRDPGVLWKNCGSQGLKNLLSSGAWGTRVYNRHNRHNRHRTNNDYC